MMTALLTSAPDLLLAAGSDPWAQRLTAGGAFLSAIIAGVTTVAALIRSNQSRPDRALRDAENNETPARMDDAQLRRVLGKMMAEGVPPQGQANAQEPNGDP